MCGTCGCSSDSKTTLVNLQTGKSEDLVSEVHEHVHADGTRHSHAHDHAHAHAHDDHEHAPGEAHEHVHADGTRHAHAHEETHEHIHAGGTRHAHADAHAEAHEHGHRDGTRHSHAHDHVHADGTSHGHADAHARSHTAQPSGEVIALETRILAKNDSLAAKNRAWFAGREILALNLVSSPGSGKTSLLERTIRDLKDELKLYVIEGDQATAADGERIRAAGAPAVQVNTGTGCHLEADMVARGVAELRPVPGSILMIENVGNLVCPALFDLGERAKVAILSVTEGEDKPLKYPHMFRAAQVMVLNKIDLLPHVDFDVAACVANARAVNPDIEVIEVSARSGAGIDAWYSWVRRQAEGAREAAFARP